MRFIKHIFRIVRHPTTIKIVGVLVILGIFFILPTFAQGTATTNSSLEEVRKVLNNILNICSWGWVILAILAGKLMTNDLVYGSILHMDIYLWKIWNIMKNFANFALIAIVLYQIIKNLIGKTEIDVKKLIINTLIAGILIQASRFLVGALIDLSTIATAAVGSFPNSFLQADTTLREKITTSLSTTPKRYIVGNTGSYLTPIGTETINGNDVRDQILPTYNSVSGPLIYLGFSVFKFQNYMDASGSDSGVGLTIAFLLRLILILFYTIGLALLFIANIIRVVFLWIFIIGMPLIILSMLFNKDQGLGGKTSSGGIGKYFKFSVLIDLVFKPVIFVAGFSMILILVVSMQKTMQGTIPKSFNGVTIGIQNGVSSMNVSDISTIEVMENGVFGKGINMTEQVTEVGQTIFVNLILFFLTAFLMRQFIKFSAISGQGPIADVMGGERGIIKTIEKMATTLPVLPLSIGGASAISVGQLLTAKNKVREQMLGGMGLNKRGEFGEYDGATGRFTTQEEKFKDRLTGGTNRKAADYTEIEKQTVAGGAFFETIKEIAKNRKGGFAISNNTNRLTALQKWIQNNTSVAKNQYKFTERTEEITPEEYFKDEKNRKALYLALGGNAATGKTYATSGDVTNVPTRDELKNLKFYATKATGSTIDK